MLINNTIQINFILLYHKCSMKQSHRTIHLDLIVSNSIAHLCNLVKPITTILQ